MTGDRNSCCCSFLLKRFEKIFLSPEQTLGLSLPCWHCHMSGCDESSVGTFSRLCKKSVVLHFFVLVQDEASDLTVFLHLDLQILINSFLWHFRYFLTAVEKRGKKKKDRKKKNQRSFFYIVYISRNGIYHLQMVIFAVLIMNVYFFHTSSKLSSYTIRTGGILFHTFRCLRAVWKCISYFLIWEHFS